MNSDSGVTDIGLEVPQYLPTSVQSPQDDSIPSYMDASADDFSEEILPTNYRFDEPITPNLTPAPNMYPPTLVGKSGLSQHLPLTTASDEQQVPQHQQQQQQQHHQQQQHSSLVQHHQAAYVSNEQFADMTKINSNSNNISNNNYNPNHSQRGRPRKGAMARAQAAAAAAMKRESEDQEVSMDQIDSAVQAVVSVPKRHRAGGPRAAPPSWEKAGVHVDGQIKGKYVDFAKTHPFDALPMAMPKREKNRIAAQRSRERRKAFFSSLEKTCKEQEHQINALKSYIKNLEAENARLSR